MHVSDLGRADAIVLKLLIALTLADTEFSSKVGLFSPLSFDCAPQPLAHTFGLLVLASFCPVRIDLYLAADDVTAP